MADTFSFLSGVLAAGLLALACLTASVVLAFLLGPQATGMARVAAVVTFACWLPIATFPLLAVPGLFRLSVALPLAVAVTSVSIAFLRRNTACVSSAVSSLRRSPGTA